MFGGGAMARAKIKSVVSIHAIGDGSESPSVGQPVQG